MANDDVVIVGVDPGVTGGCCQLIRRIESLSDDTIRNYFSNKFLKSKYDRGVIALDYYNNSFVRSIGQETEVFIETQQVRMTNSRRSVGFIWWYAGIIDTFFRMSGCKVHYVSPKQWQKAVLIPWFKTAGVKIPSNHDEWKLAAINFVTNCLDCDVRKTSESKPHSGMADAICIAEYGRMVVDGKIFHYNPWETKNKPKKKGK